MIHWKKWLWSGLLVTLILTVIASWWTAPAIENELAGDANANLEINSLKWANITMDGRDLTLTGTAPDKQAIESAIVVVTNAYDVRIVENQTQLIPFVSSYKFSSRLSDGTLLLSGFVPNTNTVENLLVAAATALPNYAITNKLKLARGQPENYLQTIKFGFSQLNKFSDGEFNLDGKGYTVAGVAKSSREYEIANSEIVDGLPGNFTLKTSNIRPPIASPYLWSAQLDASQITFTGFVPDQETRKKIYDFTSSANPGKTINDNLTYASGSPDGFSNGAGFGVSLFKHFSTAKFVLKNQGLSLVAQAATIGSFDLALNATKNDIPTGFKMLKTDITRAIVKPYKWGAKLKAKTLTLSGFVPNSSVIDQLVQSAHQIAPDRKIDNQLRIANGAPQDFSNAAIYALSLLTKLKSGEVSLDEDQIAVTGIAKSVNAYENVNSQLDANAPAGYKIATRNIDHTGISPYTWTANKQSGKLILEGYAPNAQTMATIVKKVSQSNPGAKLINKLKIATGAPDDYLASTHFTQRIFSKLQNGKAGYNDGELSITGQAASIQDYEALINLNAPADINLVAKTISPAIIKPYKIRLAMSENEITMSGYLPDEETRTRLLSAVTKLNPGAEIVGKTWIAAGIPKGVKWENSIEYGIEQLRHLNSGSFKIEVNKFSVEGVAKSVDDYRSIKSAITNNLIAGLKLANEAIDLPIASPYIWGAARNNNDVTLTGVVPSDGLVTQNIDTVKSNLGQNAGITDKQSLASGEPAGFSKVTRLALNMIGRLENSRVNLEDKKLSLIGEALSEQAAATIRTQIRNGLPKGYSGTADIKVRKVKQTQIVKADVCQALLNSMQNDNTIHFAFSKYSVREESFGLLDRLVFAAKRCPDSRISIEGHTDYFGSYRYNQGLSENRAGSVAEYLIGHGIIDSRIESVGYGESKPLVLDGTPEGNAKNRRIEFRVLN